MKLSASDQFPSAFHPAVTRWFDETFQSATPIQRMAWHEIEDGNAVLISAPTGSGKTLAAFLSGINRMIRQSLDAGLDGTAILYVSPLKALSNDIEKNLRAPLTGICQALEDQGVITEPVTAAVRTGDTSQADRQKMIRQPPNILVTTPESLFILMTSESGRNMLKNISEVIVDEIHAMAGSKRGAHLLLTLARLDALAESHGNRKPRRIGLSATQKPIERMARFLCHDGDCRIVDDGHKRDMDLAMMLPHSPLDAVMANEVWTELYDMLAELVSRHSTTLIFVNTRRLAERLTRHLEERLSPGDVMAHHGSLALAQRHQAEMRLKEGSLKALVATASLELGIDIGDVDLVCQMGSPRSIAAFLQRVGRSGHSVDKTPRGRLFPLSQDDLVECTALLNAVDQGVLDLIPIPERPLDVLAQQIVAEVACREWQEDRLYELMTANRVFAGLQRETFADICQMLAEGYATQRGRRGAYVHRDVIHGQLRGRKGARLTALTNAGVIPDQFDYDVILRPRDLRIGSVNEDFAFESIPGDIFQLGNHSYRILKVETGRVFVEDAEGLPPNLPFWFGEAPGRSDELSQAVSDFRCQVMAVIEENPAGLVDWLISEAGLDSVVAGQLATYLVVSHQALGVLPSHQELVLERFFDETGDMHLVIHSTYGSRINRALGLSLRKKFCRRFNFELQASALEDSLVLSLGPTHSFDMDEVMGWIKPDTVRETLIQALLDAPMFNVRWRWVATNALAIKRMVGGKRRPPQFQRSDADDLIAICFPDQLACQENLSGMREIPDHPLVTQAINDCLTEVMDIAGLERLLKQIQAGPVSVRSVDLTEPSPLSDAILSARPYAFLDDGAAEERRTNNVAMRQQRSIDEAATFGKIDPDAVSRVRSESWPLMRDADEVHDALLVCGFLLESETRTVEGLIDQLHAAGRLKKISNPGRPLAVATERLHEAQPLWPDALTTSTEAVTDPVDAETAAVNLIRSRLEVIGPVSVHHLAGEMSLTLPRVEQALITLEVEGTILRGRFDSDKEQWCHRRLLHRIHRYSRISKRARYQVVSAASFYRFLFKWHGLDEPAAATPASMKAVLERLQGVCVPVTAWQHELLPARLRQVNPEDIDNLCRSGEMLWLRLGASSASQIVVNTPIAILPRKHARDWIWHSRQPQHQAIDSGSEESNDWQSTLSSSAIEVCRFLENHGASFADEITSACHMLDSQFESAISELVAAGRVTSDSFSGARYLISSEKIKRKHARYRRMGYPANELGQSGRWSLIRAHQEPDHWSSVMHLAAALIERYGVVFRALLSQQRGLPPWRELLHAYRLMEARDDIAGGRFVDGFAGEQFARLDVPPVLRAVDGRAADGRVQIISAHDPLNLTGVLSDVDRVPAMSGNRIAVRDGVVVGVLVAGELRVADSADDAEYIRAALTSSATGVGRAGMTGL